MTMRDRPKCSGKLHGRDGTCELPAGWGTEHNKANGLSSLRYEGDGGEQLRAEVALWERAVDRCERILVSMARLNVDERPLKISQAQADIINDVIWGAFADIGLSRETQDAVRPAIARRLRIAADHERRALKPAQA